jgi:hypothetical protein
MAFETGPVGIGAIRAFFSGPTPSRMSNYYKNGAYVPSTKLVLEPGPSDTDFTFNSSTPQTFIEYEYTDPVRQGLSGDSNWNGIIKWNGSTIDYFANIAGPLILVADYGGGNVYYAQGFATETNEFYDFDTDTYYIYSDRHAVRRTQPQTINASIPVSGTIRLSNFRGADK